MYQVSLFNNDIETIIHYPSADAEVPHLNNLPFKESLSLPDTLSFFIYPNNLGYSLIEGLITKVKVIDTRDNTTVFSGRVIPIKNNMNSSGLFYKEVTCEGAMAYLNDTQTRRWNLQNQTPTQILTYLLSQHNAKVDDSRKILLGNIDITQAITINTNYETTLNTIISKLRNIIGGDLRVRETNGLLYLDYLQAIGADNGVKIELGYNMKDLIEEFDPTDIISRVIPMGYGEGINQLDITSVNNGIEYLENVTSKAKYGVIEGVPVNKDIQSANTLKIYGDTVLKEKSQAKLTISTSSLDLSVLAGHEDEEYGYGDSLHILNEVMNVDVIARVMERIRDLILSPENPTLTISTRPIKLSDQLVELKQRNLTLENAPQGSTFITTYNANDNLDADHNIKIPIWLSPDIIYVNRVALHIESQKFRAYEKGMAAGGSSTATSSSGGSSTATSSSGGSSTATSSSNGESSPTSSSGGSSTASSENANAWGTDWAGIVATGEIVLFTESRVDINENQPFIHQESLTHTHIVEIPAHTHSVSVPAHVHTTDVPAHVHTVSVPAHVHTVSVPAHTHTVEIPAHTHPIEYGIFEDTFTAGSKILINGVEVADGPNEGGSLDIDISYWIGIPGTAYTLEITSTQRGRVSVQVNVQAFIQSK